MPAGLREELRRMPPAWAVSLKNTARSFGRFDPLEVGECLLEHVAIQEDERVQRDILSRSRHLTMDSEVG